MLAAESRYVKDKQPGCMIKTILVTKEQSTCIMTPVARLRFLLNVVKMTSLRNKLSNVKEDENK